MSDKGISIPIENNDVEPDKPAEDTAEEKPVINEHIEMLQRLQAEFDNYRKRVQKEKAELSELAKSQLIFTLLPVLDDMNHMFRTTDVDKTDGNYLIYQKLNAILNSEGLQEIETIGKPFNPEYHEAVIIETTTDGEDNTVVEEIQKGYMFKDQLLRAAKVKVLKTEIEK